MVTSYVIISTDLTDKVIHAGPLMWDGVAPLQLPAATQAITETVAVSEGYQYQNKPVAQMNAESMRIAAGGALAGNAAYLTLATPSNPQVIAQVARLTRQLSSVVRLLLNQTDDTTGT